MLRVSSLSDLFKNMIVETCPKKSLKKFISKISDSQVKSETLINLEESLNINYHYF